MAVLPKSQVKKESITPNGCPEVPLLQPSDMSREQKRIQRSGVWQAVASNPALINMAPDIEELKKLIREVAEDGLRWVNEK